MGISEPLLPGVADSAEAGGPRLLQKVPDVVRSWAQPFLLREESGEGKDGAGLRCRWPPANVYGGRTNPALTWRLRFFIISLNWKWGS